MHGCRHHAWIAPTPSCGSPDRGLSAPRRSFRRHDFLFGAAHGRGDRADRQFRAGLHAEPAEHAFAPVDMDKVLDLGRAVRLTHGRYLRTLRRAGAHRRFISTGMAVDFKDFLIREMQLDS